MIIAVVAVSENNVIGDSGRQGLLWRLPSDLAHFRRLTYGKTLVLGRKTWDSLPKKPLPYRKHLILTRNHIWQRQVEGAFSSEDILIFSHKEAIFSYAKDQKCDLFIIGGGQIYELFLPFCQHVFLTRVHKHVEGDIFFPDLPKDTWEMNDHSLAPIQKEGDEAAYSMHIFTRKKSFT